MSFVWMRELMQRGYGGLDSWCAKQAGKNAQLAHRHGGQAPGLPSRMALAHFIGESDKIMAHGHFSVHVVGGDGALFRLQS